MLLTPELVATLQGLDLKARTIVESALAGQHRSRRKGFSSQFAEHREYTPGDDLRYIDWKIFGKRDRLHVKQFEDETRLRAWVILDTSRSMHYRSATAPMSKLGYAAILAAAIGWLTLKQRDEIGLSLVDDTEQSLSPQGHPSHLKPYLALLEQALERVPDRFLLTNQAASEPGPSNCTKLHALVERIPARSLVIWITDAFLETGDLETVLKHFRHQQQDARLIQIADPAEAEFPFEDPTLFRSLEGGADQWITPLAIRSAYLAEWKTFLKETERIVRQSGGDYLLVRTDHPFDQVLRRWLFEQG